MVHQDQGEGSNNEFDISHSDINFKPHFSNQKELDDLVRDMGLTKSNAELSYFEVERIELVRFNMSILFIEKETRKVFTVFFCGWLSLLLQQYLWSF